MATDYVGQAYRINAAIGIGVLVGRIFHMGKTIAFSGGSASFYSFHFPIVFRNASQRWDAVAIQ